MKNLLDRMIAIYGLEHEATIEFARLVETKRFTKEVLTTIVEAHEEAVYEEEEA